MKRSPFFYSADGWWSAPPAAKETDNLIRTYLELIGFQNPDVDLHDNVQPPMKEGGITNDFDLIALNGLNRAQKCGHLKHTP